jgi:hypothetical protein
LTRTLESIFDLIADLKKEGRYDALKKDLGEPEDRTTDSVLMLINDPQIRPEHRTRIYKDLLTNRERLLETRDQRIVDLVFWSEHVATLYESHVKRRVSTFHYARALEATCRRCGYALLGVVGRMKELGKVWSEGDYEKTIAMLEGTDQASPEEPDQPTS